MSKMRRPLLLLGLTSLLTVQLVRANPEPPVTNYMSNYYDPMFHDDGSLRNSHGPPRRHSIDASYPSGDLGAYDDVHDSNPYHHSSEEKGHSAGYVSSTSLADEDDHHYDPPPTKGYSGSSYSKGRPTSDRDYSPSYSGGYRPSKKGYSGTRPSYSYSSPYSSKGQKGPRPVKYGAPETYSSGSSYPYGKGSSPYSHLEDSHEDEPPRPTPSYKATSSSGRYSPNSNGYKTVEEYPGGYVPSSGYQPDGWFNTMKGGYDDYGYNDHSPKGVGYKGPGYGKVYSPYSAPSLSEHGSSKDGYSSGGPEFSPSHAYGEHNDEDDTKGSSYSTPPYSDKGSRRPKPSNGYGQNPYLSSPKGSVKTSYGTPKVTYSFSKLPPKYSYEKSQYTSSKGSSYGGPSSSYSGKGPSYEQRYGPPPKYSSSGGAKGDFSNYYRTRSGGFARKPPIMRSMTGFNYKYSTIGKPNAPRSRHEFENGRTEDYGPYNWENEGWTVAH